MKLNTGRILCVKASTNQRTYAAHLSEPLPRRIDAIRIATLEAKAQICRSEAGSHNMLGEMLGHKLQISAVCCGTVRSGQIRGSQLGRNQGVPLRGHWIARIIRVMLSGLRD